MWKCGCQEAIFKEGEKTQEHKNWERSKVMNLNLTFLVEIIVSVYRGGQERGTRESIYTHL